MALIVGTALIPHVSLAERPGTLTDPWGWENVQRCLFVAVASAYVAQQSPPVRLDLPLWQQYGQQRPGHWVNRGRAKLRERVKVEHLSPMLAAGRSAAPGG